MVDGTCFPVTWADAEYAGNLDSGVKARVEDMAGRALRMLTAYQVGGCPITVRPCAPQCAPATYLTAPVSGVLPWVPYVSNGKWFNACGHRRCECKTVNELRLPGPVSEVISVMESGVALSEGLYRVDNGNMLVRTDGKAWPVCQDMNLNDDDDGALAVTYVRGVSPGADGAFIAGILAKEFALGLQDAQECRLPPSVTSVVRQGITMELTQGQFPGGVTGVPEVDAWVQYWNPYKVKAPAGVYSPDVTSPRATTWRATSGS